MALIILDAWGNCKLERYAQEIVAAHPAAPATIEEEARAETEEYYRQLLMEKRTAAGSSASKNDTAENAG